VNAQGILVLLNREADKPY